MTTAHALMLDMAEYATALANRATDASRKATALAPHDRERAFLQVGRAQAMNEIASELIALVKMETA